MTGALNYEEMRLRSLNIIEKLFEILTDLDVDERLIHELKNNIKRPIYTVAITGPSRVGKSTLINALLNIEISPVDKLATTGIPCLYQPNPEKGIIVVLENGRNINEDYDQNNLNKWINQKYNPDNKKEVRNVIVNIDSDFLNLGFALLDLPGLDDPREKIRTKASIALESANVIFYIMNGGNYKDGSFIITENDRNVLKKLIPKMDRSFIVLNKIELLSLKERDELYQYIVKEFNSFNLLKLNESNVFFISAKNALQNRLKNEEGDEQFDKFENSIWEYLIKNENVGKNQLIGTLQQTNNIVKDQLLISSLALSDEKKRKDFTNFLNRYDNIISRINIVCNKFNFETKEKISEIIDIEINKILLRLENSLSTMSSVPVREEIEIFLENELIRTTKNIINIANNYVEKCDNKVVSIIMENNIELEKKIISEIPEVQTLFSDQYIGEELKINMMPTLFGSAITLGLGGLLFGPIGAIIGGIAGFFVGLFAGEVDRQKREKQAILNKSINVLNKTNKEIRTYTLNNIEKSIGKINNFSLIHLESSKARLEEEISKMGEPIDERKETLLKNKLNALSKIQPEIEEIINGIK